MTPIAAQTPPFVAPPAPAVRPVAPRLSWRALPEAALGFARAAFDGPPRLDGRLADPELDRTLLSELYE